MPNAAPARKPRRLRLSGPDKLLWTLARRFWRLAARVAKRDGSVCHTVLTTHWIKNFKSWLSKKDEDAAVKGLAYALAWIREANAPRGENASVQELEAAGEADFSNDVRTFYRRNIRLIAEIYLELS